MSGNPRTANYLRPSPHYSGRWAWGLALAVLGGCAHPVEEVHLPTAGAGVAAPVTTVTPAAEDWPWWRGINRDNHATGSAPPTKWSATENVLWKVDVPGRGHATPILWGDSIFVATADEAQETQLLLCYEKATGAQRWSKQLHSGGFSKIHTKNSQASATPACDGTRIYTVFAVQNAVWVSALDLQGNILWQQAAGPFEATHGYGSSPVLHAGLVIVQADNSSGGYLAALNCTTGEIVWRIQRLKDDSYGTPIVAKVAGREQLLTSGQLSVISYDPLTGAELWRCAGTRSNAFPARTTGNTMAFLDDLVFAGGGYPEAKVMAIRADGNGDVSGTHIVWEDQFKLYVPSPLVVEDRLLAVGDDGVAKCYSAKDGQQLWMKRLEGNFSASPVLVQDLVYVPDERGALHVFQATADGLKKVAKNDLGDGGMASPVIAGGRLYLRTGSHLYCIGVTDEAAAPKSDVAPGEEE